MKKFFFAAKEKGIPKDHFCIADEELDQKLLAMLTLFQKETLTQNIAFKLDQLQSAQSAVSLTIYAPYTPEEEDFDNKTIPFFENLISLTPIGLRAEDCIFLMNSSPLLSLLHIDGTIFSEEYSILPLKDLQILVIQDCNFTLPAFFALLKS